MKPAVGHIVKAIIRPGQIIAAIIRRLQEPPDQMAGVPCPKTPPQLSTSEKKPIPTSD